MGKSTTAISVLIASCIILFALTLLPSMEEGMYRTLALFFPKHEAYRPWQYVTNVFMHGGFAHIFFNMYALWAFGSPLEQMWGKRKFLLFFFLSGVGASIIYTAVNYVKFNQFYNELASSGVSSGDIYALLHRSRDEIYTLLRTEQYDPSVMGGFSKERLVDFWALFNTPVVGASGAIYGVLVAFGILFPNAKLFLIFLPVPIAAKYFIPALIALDLFSGVTGFSIFGGGIAHFGHVGGAIIGFLLMWYWRNQGPKRRYSGVEENG